MIQHRIAQRNIALQNINYLLYQCLNLLSNVSVGSGGTERIKESLVTYEFKCWLFTWQIFSLIKNGNFLLHRFCYDHCNVNEIAMHYMFCFCFYLLLMLE